DATTALGSNMAGTLHFNVRLHCAIRLSRSSGVESASSVHRQSYVSIFAKSQPVFPATVACPQSSLSFAVFREAFIPPRRVSSRKNTYVRFLQTPCIQAYGLWNNAPLPAHSALAGADADWRRAGRRRPAVPAKKLRPATAYR